MFIKTDVQKWLDKKRQLDTVKEEEMELRLKLTPLLLKDKLSGSKTGVIDGIKLRATARLNYTIDPAELALIQDSLSPEEQACIAWRPSILETAYNKLDEHAMLRTAVTVTPGTPGLTPV